MARKRKVIYGDREVFNMEHQRLDHYPIVCPFCDEPSKIMASAYDEKAIREKQPRVLVTSQKVYYPRVCEMGHTFWTVESVPDKYEQMLDEIDDIMEYAIECLDEEERISEYESMKAEKKAKERAKIVQRNATKRYLKKKRKEAKAQKRLEEKQKLQYIEQLKAELAEKKGVDYVCFNWPIIKVIKLPGEKGYHERIGRKKRAEIKEKLERLSNIEAYYKDRLAEFEANNIPVDE